MFFEATWSTQRTKQEPKYLMSTLRTLWEFLWSKYKRINFSKTMTNISLILSCWFVFLIYNKKIPKVIKSLNYLTIYSTFFFCSSVIINVYLMWPKTTRILPMWPKKAKRLDTPGLTTIPSELSSHLHPWFAQRQQFRRR